jgi:hypothetical protein
MANLRALLPEKWQSYLDEAFHARVRGEVEKSLAAFSQPDWLKRAFPESAEPGQQFRAVLMT